MGIVLTLWFYTLPLWLICQINWSFQIFALKLGTCLDSLFYNICFSRGLNYQPLKAEANTASANDRVSLTMKVLWAPAEILYFTYCILDAVFEQVYSLGDSLATVLFVCLF